MKSKAKKMAQVSVGLLLVAFFGPAIGKHGLLYALTPAWTLTAWRSEAERLDHLFPREPSNEAQRHELLRKLRQRSGSMKA